jgi:uncharacterized membrane protein YdjX (TVP38/TMEM64 family)
MRPFPRALLATLVVSVVLVGWVLVAPATVADRIASVVFNPWFPAILLGLYVVRPFFAWPITAVSVIVGYRYGVWIGLPVALLGAAFTSLIPYTIARYLRTDVGWLGRLTDGSERFFTTTGHLRGVIAARLAPTPAEVVSGAAGIANVSVPAFVVGTIIGELPWTIAAVFVGSTLHDVSFSASILDSRLLIVGVVGALLVLARPTYRYVIRINRSE